ncbi:uncharacterized protein LOC126899059 isoform X2 [Daktulosphaira vitifoliae]|uniref:uncharacterized protein LOC126899059 isoform X2 n=1 Tax=Daktulosphaira vitifoliae TaxID=58002 RepID=UPI0021A97836|nr:uncharacterized protein LOC126899059 isoform X2 [Daktulosphaira vitifoliae]
MDEGAGGGSSGNSTNRRILPPLYHHQIQQQQQQQQQAAATAAAAAAAAQQYLTVAAAAAAANAAVLQQHSSSSYNGEVQDRSDSGLSSSRTLNSSDERSGSHSSAFSGSDDHGAATSPLNEQQSFNNVRIWRDPSLLQHPVDGPIRHVDSVQHQSLFMSSSAQMSQAPLPFQSFHPPSSTVQPMNVGGMMWKPPPVSVSNSNGSGGQQQSVNYYQQHANDQQFRLNNRSNVSDKDAAKYKEAKKSRSNSQVSLTSSSRTTPTSIGHQLVAVDSKESREYRRMEIDRLMNRQRHSEQQMREHSEKKKAEAAVHQHFEESLKLAQQQRRSNWISNLPTPPKNIFPLQGSKTSQEINTKGPPVLTPIRRSPEDWKDKGVNSAGKHTTATTVLPRLTPITTMPPSRSSAQIPHRVQQQQTSKKLYDGEKNNVTMNVHDGLNHNMISYAHFMQQSSNNNSATAAYPPSPSPSSVIVRNDSTSHKNGGIVKTESVSYYSSVSPGINMTSPHEIPPQLEINRGSTRALESPDIAKSSSRVPTSASRYLPPPESLLYPANVTSQQLSSSNSSSGSNSSTFYPSSYPGQTFGRSQNVIGGHYYPSVSPSYYHPPSNYRQTRHADTASFYPASTIRHVKTSGQLSPYPPTASSPLLQHFNRSSSNNTPPPAHTSIVNTRSYTPDAQEPIPLALTSNGHNKNNDEIQYEPLDLVVVSDRVSRPSSALIIDTIAPNVNSIEVHPDAHTDAAKVLLGMHTAIDIRQNVHGRSDSDSLPLKIRVEDQNGTKKLNDANCNGQILSNEYTISSPMSLTTSIYDFSNKTELIKLERKEDEVIIDIGNENSVQKEQIQNDCDEDDEDEPSPPALVKEEASPLSNRDTNGESKEDEDESTGSPPVLMPAPPYTTTESSCGSGGSISVKTPHHHKLKKAWLQRHTRTEDLKEATASLSLEISKTIAKTSSVDISDDVPPVLSCETATLQQQQNFNKKRSAGGGSGSTALEMSSCDSDADMAAGPKKRKVSNATTFSGNKSASDSDETIFDGKDDDADDNGSSGKVDEITTRQSTIITNHERKQRNSVSTSSTKMPKKRGRKPKLPVSLPAKKVCKSDDIAIGSEEDGDNFFQSGPCLNAGPKIHKCRECRLFLSRKKKDTCQDDIDNIFCRFYAFRLLYTNKNGQLTNAGFPDPFKDVTEEDLELWTPNSQNPPDGLDVTVAKKVLEEAGRQFCYLVKEENEALTLTPFAQDKPIAWKKAANGVREMCDVCLTTIFNYHWACAKCGFGVCIDCVKSRLNGSALSADAASMTKKDLREKDTFMWITCTNRQNHDIDRLMLTQIVAGDSLNLVNSKMHEICTINNIRLDCGCPSHGPPSCNSVEQQNGLSKEDNATKSCNEPSTDSKTDSTNENALTEDKVKKDNNTTSVTTIIEKKIDERKVDDKKVVEEPITAESKEKKVVTLKHYVKKKNKYPDNATRRTSPVRVMTVIESRQLYPDIPHSWLCDGKLLRLLDPENPFNYVIFQEQWKRGQPVMISDVGKSLNPQIWHPKSFSKDFGQYKNDLVDCSTGRIVSNKMMKQFWDGFENENDRLTDSSGNKMLLKLKDWPVTADFAETLPDRFDDLMRALPLKDYTHRDGKLNLASRLPDCFVRPDLGPKMYSAYGNACNPDPGKRMLSTTNLHLDVSDAVNVMVFVGVTRDGNKKGDDAERDHDWHVKEAYRAIDEAGCDIASRRRAREAKEIPGAVWHIYHADDADAIRDLLNKVSAEEGKPAEPNHDPIHDQSSYLDADLRARLYNEYGIEGYAIVQCLGDAVFVPAGAPHQVRNLHNCIKIAEDFVSPENVSQCFRLMNEFRELSKSHDNHEDKLQIKNIMYHAIKDSLSVMLHDRLQSEQS